ncbi:MAG: hypothetical protein KF859_05740 [Phycisphaeraceae bacterium]|nr:hypothetical protein [Phycisphaeraceae bacterium]
MASNKDKVLNETLSSPGMHIANFVPGQCQKVRIEQGTELFKFTDGVNKISGEGLVHGLFTGGAVSPWWAYVRGGQQPGDPGLDGLLNKASGTGCGLADFARAQFAVMFGWNTMKNCQSGLIRVQRVRLLLPVYGFYGPCRRAINDQVPLAKPGKQDWFAGGAMQLYIPNLTGEHVMGTGLNML